MHDVELKFDAWASNYDADATKLYNWRGPLETVGPVKRYLPVGALILDAGAGTGLVGEALANHGYTNMIAVDLSQKMLDIANTKSVYRGVFKADLLKSLPFQDGILDAVLCIGTFSYLTSQVISEFTRIIKPGGYIIYIINDTFYYKRGFETAVKEAALEVVEIGPRFASIPLVDPDHKSRIHVLRR